MKTTALVLAAVGLLTSPAHATPRSVPQMSFETSEQCVAALESFWRGNHAFYCEWSADGWYIAYDQGYEAAKKGPKKR
jgi:hypothetical protein